ncbi:PaaX family transcriptional regulator [Rhodococcoides fascians]|uniref:PaaX family transcriptional regulator n=1 Tax=Rhodococcoides fascians TaxID=1828 RepID=UPI000691CB7D|nr:PaaX family transcriptional regulator C-terminal domain-containing protein [Rhodococcus fascians]
MSSPPQPSSQNLLITLLGTYFYGQRAPIPSAFLVRLLQEFDVTEVGARNGLSRVAKRGLLEVSKPGRNTFYRLSDDAHDHHAERLSEIVNFGDTEPEWDGTWTMVLFSVAEKDRAQRHLVRHRLASMRFAMLYDGVWVKPGALPEHAAAALKILELQKATVLTHADVAGVFGSGDPVHAFSTEKLREHYEEFVADFAPLKQRMEAGEIGAADALLQRTSVMDRWRYFPDHDPALPKGIRPEPWPLEQARKMFISIYDGLAELADMRLRSLLTEFAPDLADDVRSPTSAQIAGMNIPAKGMGPLTGMP